MEIPKVILDKPPVYWDEYINCVYDKITKHQTKTMYLLPSWLIPRIAIGVATIFMLVFLGQNITKNQTSQTEIVNIVQNLEFYQNYEMFESWEIVSSLDKLDSKYIE